MSLLETFLDLGQQLECISNEDRASYLRHNGRYSRPFIITMRKDVERYASASSLLLSLNQEPIQFFAVEGTKLEDLELFRYGFPQLRPGEKGCLASHLVILALAASHPIQDQFTLVFEDDVVSTLVGDAFEQHLETLSPILERENADIVHLGKCLESCSAMTHIEGIIYRAVAPACTHALAIRNSFARRVITEFRDYNTGIDCILGDYIKHKLVTGLVFHPGLFFQNVLQFESGLRLKKEQLINYLECNDTCGQHICPNPRENREEPQEEPTTRTDKPEKKPKLVWANWLWLIVAAIVGCVIFLAIYTMLKHRCKHNLAFFYGLLGFAIVMCIGIFLSRVMRTPDEGKDNGTKSYRAMKPHSSEPIIEKSIATTITIRDASRRTGYNIYNPNFVYHSGFLYTAIRANNDKHTYTVIKTESDGKVISEIILDPKARGQGWNDSTNVIKDKKTCETGLEDMRLFVFRDTLWLTGVNLDANGCRPRMVLFDLTSYLAYNEENVLPLVYPPVMDGPNKNWAPLVLKQPYGETLLYVIDFDPLLIVKPDLDTGRCHLVYKAEKSTHDLFARPRNSTIMIHLREKLFLMMIHVKYVQSDFIPIGSTVYFQHRFATIDMDTMETQISGPFNIEEKGLPHIEYLSGLLLDATKREVVLGYGLRDREAKMVRFSYDKVNKCFGKRILY